MFNALRPNSSITNSNNSKSNNNNNNTSMVIKDDHHKEQQQQQQSIRKQEIQGEQANNYTANNINLSQLLFLEVKSKGHTYF